MITIKELFGFCSHKWSITKEFKVHDYVYTDRTVAWVIVQQCDKCGKIRKARIES